jgi:hypothetical protein
VYPYRLNRRTLFSDTADCRWKHPNVHFIPNEGKPVKMAVEMPKSATIWDLKKLVGDRMGVDPSKVCLSKLHANIVNVGGNLFEKILQTSYGRHATSGGGCRT